MDDVTSTPATTADLVKQDLEKTKIELEEQRKASASKITELSNTNATLQMRMAEIENKKGIEEKIKITQANQDRISSVLERAKVDPSGASVELNNILEDQKRSVIEGLAPKMQEAIDTAVHVQLLRRDNPELVKHEKLILASIQMKQRETPNLTFRDALDKTVAEFKDLTKSTSPATQPIPSGARGETGVNPPPPPPTTGDDEPTDPDVIARREIAIRNAKLNGRARATGAN